MDRLKIHEITPKRTIQMLFPMEREIKIEMKTENIL